MANKRRLSNSLVEEDNDEANETSWGSKLNILEKNQGELKAQLGRLTHVVLSLKRELRKGRLDKRIKATENLIPKIPFQNVEDVISFDMTLRDSTKFKTLCGNFSAIVGMPQNFVRKCWQCLLGDDAAIGFTWMGTELKKAARNLTAAAVIRTAFQDKYKGEDLKIFEEKSMKFFHYARDRKQKKEKYAASKN